MCEALLQTCLHVRPFIVEDGEIHRVANMSALCHDLAKIAEDDSILVVIARVYQLWCLKG